MARTIEIMINGRRMETLEGKTILEVCQEKGIYIPTLCHLEGLTSRGSCRMCLVRVEGAKTFLPACTTEAKEGMVVITEDQELVSLKKSILELLFSERNHLCMFCEKSGDCKLQSLAYRFGLDHVRYSFNWRKFQLDVGRKYFLFDQNRCILCRRCIRACEEIAGHAVLTVKDRGPDLMVCADLDLPFEQSTCVSCGTCLQVCPTGALSDKYSAYVGREEHFDRKRTVCTFCSIGCSIDVLSRDGVPAKIEGVWNEGPSSGILCVKGRFEPFYEDRPKIKDPMIRKNGQLVPVDWDEAESHILENLKLLGGVEPCIGLISSRVTNEAAKVFKAFFGQNGYLIEGSGAPEGNATLSDIDAADVVVVAGINLEKDCQVASSFVKRAFNRGAEVVVIGSAGKNVDKRATKRYRNWNEKVTTALQEGANPVLLYGGGVDSQQLRRIRELCPEIKCVGLANGVNSRGLEREGIPLWEGKEIEKAVYVIACDETLDERLEFNLRKAEFIIVQSAFETSLTRKAHVVLPSPSWQERSGTYINTEGMVRRLEGATLKAGSTKPDEYMLSRLLERRMG